MSAPGAVASGEEAAPGAASEEKAESDTAGATAGESHDAAGSASAGAAPPSAENEPDLQAVGAKVAPDGPALPPGDDEKPSGGKDVAGDGGKPAEAGETEGAGTDDANDSHFICFVRVGTDL